MELPYQTYERVTGKKWTGGSSPDVQSAYKQYGITEKAGSAEANLALQNKLNASGSKVDPIKSTVGLASSTTLAGGFNANSTTLNDKLKTGTTDATKTGTGLIGNDVPNAPFKEPAMVKEPTSPDKLDINALLESNKNKIEPEYEKRKQDYEGLYKTQFANYDQAYANDVMGINQIFGQRIETQKRLDKIDIDRRKAYGLGASGNAQYIPIEYSDGITNRERKSADDIQKLDTERNNLLSKAKQVMEEGKASALENMLKEVSNVEEKMRNAIKDSLNEAKLQNDLAWANYEREKKEFTEQISERAKRAVFSMGDDYNNAKTPDEKLHIIEQAIIDQGGNPTDPTLLINMEGAFKANADKAYKDNITKTKDKLSIESSILANNKKASSGGMTATEKNKLRDDDVANALLTLDDMSKKNKTKGILQSQYDQIKALIKADYGANAVLDFEKKFKDKKLRIVSDTVTKK